MECISQEKITALRKLIQASARVAVAGHIHPDGDALGSTTALALYLQEICGKEAVCLYPDSAPELLSYAQHPAVRYLSPDRDPAACREAIAQADLIVVLDCNGPARTEGLQPALEASRAPKVLIDHHLNPQSAFFDLVFSTPEISSASELLYWILQALAAGEGSPDLFARTGSRSDRSGDPSPAATTIGTALLAGMTTDTNNFANSVFPSTFRMASELLAAGVDRDALLQKIYNSYRENRIRLMGYMQSQALNILPEGAAYMILTREIQERFQLREGESEGLVNVPLAIGAVRLSLLLKEDDGHFRVSLRSKKGTSAQACAQRFFHGGGHENAAGGRLFPADLASPEALVPYIENALKSVLS